MKICSKCLEEKDNSSFWKRNNRKSGVNSECKDCAKSRRTKSYKENIIKCREKRKEYYNKNRDKLCGGQVESQKGNVRYRKYQNKYLTRKRKQGDIRFIARQILGLAVKAGMLKKPEVCSTCFCYGRIEGHHMDYMKPLDIVWVCSKCHKAIHKKEKIRI